MPSDFLKQKELERKAYVTAAERTTEQLCLDTAQIALHRLGWGYDRIMRFTAIWNDLYNYYFNALAKPKSKLEDERDVYREHLDAEIRQITQDKHPFYPFLTRYPEAGKVTYEPKKK